MRLFVAALFAAMSSLACGHPADRAPPGYADACWGGRDNYPRYIAFTDRRLLITVAAHQEDWERLANTVLAVAAEHGLAVFDSSIPGDHLSELRIEACHASGISLRVEKRTWGSVRTFDQPPPKVEITLYTYRPDAPFEPIGDTLVKKLQATWKKAKVERFPAVPPSKKALPDSVRHLLVQECTEATAPKPDYCEGF